MHSPLELEAVARALATAFPDAGHIAPLRVLGEGFRSTVVATADGIAFKVGRSPDASADYARESRGLPLVRAHVTVAVPEARWYVASAPGLPFGALGYWALPGRPPRWGEPPPALAHDLGGFLAELHAIPVEEALAAGVPAVDARARLLEARQVVADALLAHFDAAEHGRIEAWWDALEADPRMHTGRVATSHHDLWHDNLLVDAAGRLTGVLDFAHLQVGDPAHDFAAPRLFGAPFVGALVKAYRAAGGRFDANDAYCAERYWQGRDLGGLAWAVEHDDPAELVAAIEKIRRGPLLSGSS